MYQTRSVATNCDILDENQFMTMLHLYHDLGVFIYFGGDRTDQEALKNIVILDPQWLINVFKAVITILPDKEQVSLQFFRCLASPKVQEVFRYAVTEGCVLCLHYFSRYEVWRKRYRDTGQLQPHLPIIDYRKCIPM